MYEVQHKETIPPLLPVAKRGYALNCYQTENIQYISLQVEKWLPMASYFHVSMILSPLAMSSIPCNLSHGRP